MKHATRECHIHKVPPPKPGRSCCCSDRSPLCARHRHERPGDAAVPFAAALCRRSATRASCGCTTKGITSTLNRIIRTLNRITSTLNRIASTLNRRRSAIRASCGCSIYSNTPTSQASARVRARAGPGRPRPGRVRVARRGGAVRLADDCATCHACMHARTGTQHTHYTHTHHTLTHTHHTHTHNHAHTRSG
jgi:hypothetical protein